MHNINDPRPQPATKTIPADVRSHIQKLERRLDSLVLVNAAMWELIRDNTNLNDENIIERMNDIDLRDGKLDGRLPKTIRPCPSCGKPMRPGIQQCQFCSSYAPLDSPFDGCL